MAALSQGSLESVFNSSTSVNELLGLIAGTSSKYVNNSTNSGARLPSYSTASPPSSPQAGDIWYNSSTQYLQYFNGVSTQNLNSGSSVTSITAGTGLSGGTITRSGTISLPNVGTAGTYTKVTTDAQGRVTSGDSLYLSDLKSSQGGDLFSYPSCTSNQSLTWSSLTDKFTCQNITVSAGGSSNNVQFNSSGSLQGDSQLIWDNSQKRLGINAPTPAAKLDVGGDIKVGDSSAACTSANKGSIRYNNSLSVLEFCNGTSWNLIQAAACSDATPNFFNFNNVADHTLSTLTLSNILQITGINCTVPVTISGPGTPEFQICSDSACANPIQGWTNSPSSIVNGQYLQLRQTSHSTGGASNQAIVIIGTTASVWTVSTAGGDCVNTTPPVGTVCTDGTVYAGITPDGNVKMFTTRCDIGQTWNGSLCTGSSLDQSWNNGGGVWSTTGRTSAITGEENTNYLFTLADAGAPYNAASVCKNLTDSGHTDWYLPARNELNVLYLGKDMIKNFNSSSEGSYYWSSTELHHPTAISQIFSTGSNGCCGNGKNNAARVRCVRK